MVPGRSSVDRAERRVTNTCADRIVRATSWMRAAQALGDLPWDQFTTNPFALVGRPAITPRGCSAPAPVMR
jgi:hypothetical protein